MFYILLMFIKYICVITSGIIFCIYKYTIDPPLNRT